MTMLTTPSLTVLCIASFFKGNEFIRECRREAASVVLLTREKLLGAAWARDCLDDIVALPAGSDCDLYVEAASFVARSRRVDRVVALEEYDVTTAGRIRERLRLPGASAGEAQLFQDKLAMREAGRAAGLRAPDFVRLCDGGEVAEFLGRVAPPWMLKPRRGASAMGMRRLHDAGEAWRALAELDSRREPREGAAQYLIEEFIPGEVFHVDSLVSEGRVRFASVGRYGVPPFEIAHGGGVSTSHTVKRGSQDERRLLALNRRLLAAFRFEGGATHAEYIKGARDGEFYFLEVAARVGGAHTSEMVEAATGINLWREWARIVLSGPEHPYALPPAREDYAGLVISLARQEWPDTSAYADPEIVCRVRKPWHAGLVLRSPSYERVATLTETYARRFSAELTAVAPPEETPDQHL